MSQRCHRPGYSIASSSGIRDFAERESWNIGGSRIAASVRLDVGCPDHLAPLLGFIGDQLAEVGG
jgi:hypothetical protein